MCRIVDSLCLFKALIETAELLSQIKENNNTRITLECSISRSPNLGLIVHWEPYSMVSRDMIWYKKNLKKAANFFSNFLPRVYLFRLQLLKLYLLMLCCSGSEARTVPVVFSIYFPLQLSFPPHHEGGVMAERSSWSADWCLTLLPILDNKINLTPQHRWESLTWNSCPPIFIFIPLSLFFCRIVLELNFKDVVNMIFWLFFFSTVVGIRRLIRNTLLILRQKIDLLLIRNTTLSVTEGQKLNLPTHELMKKPHRCRICWASWIKSCFVKVKKVSFNFILKLFIHILAIKCDQFLVFFIYS